MRKKAFFIIPLIVVSISCFAQNNPAPTNPNWQEKFFKSETATLPILIDAALKNSTQILRLETTKEAAEEQLKLTKKQIFNGIGISSGYNYGTRLNLVGPDLQQVGGLLPFNLPASSSYTIGLNMRFGLLDIIGRRHNIKQQQVQVKQVDLDKELQIKEVKIETINLYKKLMLARIVLLHNQDALQSAKVNKAIADKKFKDGEMQVDAQIAAIGFYNQALLSFEQAKNDYETTELLMEELIGVSLKDLMTSK